MDAGSNDTTRLFTTFPAVNVHLATLSSEGRMQIDRRSVHMKKKNVNLIGLMSNCSAAHYVTAAFLRKKKN